MTQQAAQKVTYQDTRNRVGTPAVLIRDSRGGLWEETISYLTGIQNTGALPVGTLPHRGKDIPVYIPDQDSESWTWAKVTRTASPCVHDAVKKYLEGMGLGTLTLGDKDWFSYHPNVNTDGVTRAHVLGVVQGLVYPWGLGISRVQFPKGSALVDEQFDFMVALGVNPMGLVDHTTSNTEYEELAGIKGNFRFEFTTTPTCPCVIMEAVSTANKVTSYQGGVATTYTVNSTGHSTFLGPRDIPHESWQIAIQIDRLGNITYYGDVSKYAHTELLAAESEQTLSLWKLTFNGKKCTPVYNQPVSQPPLAGTGYPHLVGTGASKHTGTGVQETGLGAKPKATPQILPAQAMKKPDSFVETDERCPECAAKLTLYDKTYFCWECHWYGDDPLDNDDVAEDQVCPTCGQPLVSTETYTGCPWCGRFVDIVSCPFCGSEIEEGACVACMFNSHDFEVGLNVCATHDCEVLQYVDQARIIKVCPDCIQEFALELEEVVKVYGVDMYDLGANEGGKK